MPNYELDVIFELISSAIETDLTYKKQVFFQIAAIHPYHLMEPSLWV